MEQTRSNGQAGWAECLLRVFESMSCGAAVIDRSKRIVQMNGRARQVVGDAFVVKEGRLSAPKPDADRLLQMMLDHHLRPKDRLGQTAPATLTLPRREGQRMIARVVTIDADERHFFSEGALIFVLIDPDECPQPSAIVLREAFGLTGREADVARRLICGESLRNIARECSVSLETVRSQVKSIFQKTHTRRQAELVALLTRLALIS